MTPPSLEQIITGIDPMDSEVEKMARERTAQLVMPPRALGQLHNTAEKLCGIYGNLIPVIDKKAVIIMAGDHGVAASGVSAFPQEVTGAMIQTFLAGGAGINAIARYVGLPCRWWIWVYSQSLILPKCPMPLILSTARSRREQPISLKAQP